MTGLAQKFKKNEITKNFLKKTINEKKCQKKKNDKLNQHTFNFTKIHLYDHDL